MAQDLMTYLNEAYDKHIVENKVKLAAGDNLVGEFVTFCKTELKKNPPVSVFMAERGIGLRLADGTEVSIMPDESANKEYNQYMPITNPKRSPLGDVSDNRSVPIFGK